MRKDDIGLSQHILLYPFLKSKKMNYINHRDLIFVLNDKVQICLYAKIKLKNKC